MRLLYSLLEPFHLKYMRTVVHITISTRAMYSELTVSVMMWCDDAKVEQKVLMTYAIHIERKLSNDVVLLMTALYTAQK